MKIQSLSLAVPCKCPNNCKFCVSHIHNSHYPNYLEIENPKFSYYYWKNFEQRLMFARDNGCNTLIITGSGEPLTNRAFLEEFSFINEELHLPFRWIELQTSGVLLNDLHLSFLKNQVKCSIISLSLSSLDSNINTKYNQIPNNLKFNINELCSKIKDYDFTLRLSLNMTDYYNDKSPEFILNKANQFNADQLTFRILYKSQSDCEQNQWIDQHRTNPEVINKLKQYVTSKGTPISKLPFGATKYAIQGLSVVIDDDCMNTEIKNTYKYLILRPNAKLYTKWDYKESLLF